jgi:hypothetical protein
MEEIQAESGQLEQSSKCTELYSRGFTERSRKMLEARPILRSEIPQKERLKHRQDDIKGFVESFARSNLEAIEVVYDEFKNITVLKHTLLRAIANCAIPTIKVVCRSPRLFLVKNEVNLHA